MATRCSSSPAAVRQHRLRRRTAARGQESRVSIGSGTTNSGLNKLSGPITARSIWRRFGYGTRRLERHYQRRPDQHWHAAGRCVQRIWGRRPEDRRSAVEFRRHRYWQYVVRRDSQHHSQQPDQHEHDGLPRQCGKRRQEHRATWSITGTASKVNKRQTPAEIRRRCVAANWQRENCNRRLRQLV